MVPWSELEPDQAETLLAVLLYNEHRRAVRIRPSRGDYGIDVLNPNPITPETFDVYQIKYFHGTLTASQKGQVEKSFRRLLIGLVRLVRHVIFHDVDECRFCPRARVFWPA